MHRLFVAIRPPAPIRAILLGAMGGISGARWQSEDQLHLTLRFIGEVDRHLASDIHAALGAVHQPPFEIARSGIGAVDRRGWPDAALTRVGVAPDQRAFLPHITLARLKRDSGPVGNLLEQSGGLTSPPFTVDHLGLFESVLTPDGAVYSLVERYRLG